jgi:hypothetical protein
LYGDWHGQSLRLVRNRVVDPNLPLYRVVLLLCRPHDLVRHRRILGGPRLLLL